MPFICDAHVHFYSMFDLGEAVKLAAVNLSRLRADARLPLDAPAVLCLTERFDCHYFSRLRRQAPVGLQVAATGDVAALKLSTDDGAELLLIAGRQIVTAERVELLALCTDSHIPDGQPLPETHEQILAADGLPVLNWAPGKWMFKRKEIVADFIAGSTPLTLALGDTSLRPTIWSEPLLMRKSRLAGYPVIAGSDPLPFVGEQRRIGTYGLAYGGTFNSELPATEFKRIVRSDGQQLRIVGRRGGLMTVAERLNTHRNVGKIHRETHREIDGEIQREGTSSGAEYSRGEE